MSRWQMESGQDVPSNLPLKFHQNRVRYSRDIADIEFLWVGWGMQSNFLSNPTKVILGWVELWLRFWATDIKMNMEGLYETFQCRACGDESVIQNHGINCKFLLEMNEECGKHYDEDL